MKRFSIFVAVCLASSALYAGEVIEVSKAPAGSSQPASAAPESQKADAVRVDPSTSMPDTCPGFPVGKTLLPIAVGVFTDHQPDRKISTLVYSDVEEPLLLDRAIADLFREGVSLLLAKCGYAIAASDAPNKVTMTADVVSFTMKWKNRTFSGRGKAEAVALFSIEGPSGELHKVEVRVSGERGGIRSKAKKRVEEFAVETYRAFLTQVARYAAFHEALERASAGVSASSTN